MKIDKTKLKALEAHIANEGDTDVATIAKIIGCGVGDEEILDAYEQALQPETPAEPDPEPTTYKLVKDGIVTDLVVVKTKGSLVVLADA